jgi:hypothetical protein
MDRRIGELFFPVVDEGNERGKWCREATKNRRNETVIQTDLDVEEKRNTSCGLRSGGEEMLLMYKFQPPTVESAIHAHRLGA